METNGTLTAGELLTFARAVPASAAVTVSVTHGDQRDPREAGYRKTTITATWDAVAQASVLRTDNK